MDIHQVTDIATNH